MFLLSECLHFIRHRLYYTAKSSNWCQIIETPTGMHPARKNTGCRNPCGLGRMVFRPSREMRGTGDDGVVQQVRAPDCQSGSRRFKPARHRRRAQQEILRSPHMETIPLRFPFLVEGSSTAELLIVDQTVAGSNPVSPLGSFISIAKEK